MFTPACSKLIVFGGSVLITDSPETPAVLLLSLLSLTVPSAAEISAGGFFTSASAEALSSL